ncbi:MAG: thiamine pyrophosphate-binding protein [Alphaproteobacteria bacterium]|nr:MAG: thiamine pyrophosphate-binding protein [Alphaproteobacteria bacterium]
MCTTPRRASCVPRAETGHVGEPPHRGADALVAALAVHGGRMAFGVPGESYLAVLDALRDRTETLPFITCRHEAAAANMAEACGKLTGTPGLALVTRGPGATHASIGLHTAFQDSTPMLLLIGQIARGMRDREAFQEIDYRRFLPELTKWTGEVDDPDRMAEYVGRAIATATAGRQGPVALALPEDVLSAPARRQEALAHPPVGAAPHASDIERVARRLHKARRPLLLLGGGPWTEAAALAIRRLAERHHIPVAVSFRCQGLIDNRSPVYAGHLGIGANPALIARVRKSDCLIAIGPRLGEMTTGGYSRLDPARPQPQLIHVHAGAEELGRVYRAGLLVNATPAAFAEALAANDIAGDWSAWCAAAVAEEMAWRTPLSNPGPVQIAELMRTVRAALPEEAIVSNGAGNYAAFLHRFFVYQGFRTQLAPTSGAMGYGVPAGIAAALLCPDRPVVAFAGDGCFLMSGNELATAARYGARVVFIVLDNAMYGTIRMHQERHYPGRSHGTDLANPDFVAYAKSFGLEAVRVERTEEMPSALTRALASGGPALIHVPVDPRAIAPGRILEDGGGVSPH